MQKPDQQPDRSIGKTDSSSRDNKSAHHQHEPSRRGQTEIQGEDIEQTGTHRDRQPQQSKVPDAELYGD